MGKLDGKIAIISGGARGQGAVEARMFVAEGAKVLLGDLRDDEGAAVAAEIGDAALYTHLDVTDPAQWEAAVALAASRFGGVDVLINNAGIARPGTIEDTELDLYHQIVAINQTGTWLGIRAVAPAMRERGGGSIVNLSSAAGMRGTPGLAAYGATKWAVRGLTKTAALELAGDRIRVNSVHPGIIDTEMLNDIGIENARETLVSAAPYGRVGEAEDVAKLVLFLACDDSDYCTGSEFIVDGGYLAGPTQALAARAQAAVPAGAAN